MTPSSLRLDGRRIGLSGAVPERSEWPAGRALERDILRFVAAIADEVFARGGFLVHGTHPTFTPILTQAAAHHRRSDGLPPLHLVRSRLWLDDMLRQDIEARGQTGDVRLVETDAIADPDTQECTPANTTSRNLSLATMRETLIADLDALVVIGGKSWQGSTIEPGIEVELGLALKRDIPCFVLGGFGGLAAEIVREAPYREMLVKGIGERRFEVLAETRDYGVAVLEIVLGVSGNG